jgi:GH18 family chitinase
MFVFVSHQSSAAESAEAAFRIVGYLPDYRTAEYDLSRATGLTDLIVFSAEPTADGRVNLDRLQGVPWSKLRQFKTAHRVRLILCLGGWDRSKHFSDVVETEQKMAAFVDSVVQLCLDRRLDGVDLDWEHPKNEAEQIGYGRLLAELNRAFDEHGLVLSVTIAAWQKLPTEAIDSVDWVNVMAYDHDGSHSTFDGAVRDVELQKDQGVPLQKITLGLPFYGRHVINRDVAKSYQELRTAYRLTPETDEVDGFSFNGPATIRRKTEFAQQRGLAGVMIWELGQDAVGEQSLLQVIRRTVASPLASP